MDLGIKVSYSFYVREPRTTKYIKLRTQTKVRYAAVHVDTHDAHASCVQNHITMPNTCRMLLALSASIGIRVLERVRHIAARTLHLPVGVT